jgi:hypothetical protein
MSKVSSHADIMADWDELLEAIQSNPDLQPLVDTERQTLVKLLADAQGFKARQNELKGLRQEVTQNLADTVAKGKVTVTAIRSMLRGKVGPKSERLVHFKIAPLRKRPRKSTDKTAKKPVGGAPGVTPGSSATPSGGSAA